MACYSPIPAFRGKHARPNGSYPILFDINDPRKGDPIMLPCGKCVGCRLEYSRQWGIRCFHEASLYDDNCFITLTYDNEHLPVTGNLVPRDLQLFFKRLRKKYGEGIRFFAAGEYGGNLGRPHYHACVFNHDFEDKYAWQRSKSGELLYRSPSLEKLWKYGYSSIGSVTFESAAYVARYIMKKVNGDEKQDHYSYIDCAGRSRQRVPEFTRMSRGQGIGKPWFARFYRDVYPDDFVIINGRKMKPPRYYDQLYKEIDPEGFAAVKAKREEKANENLEEQTDHRLKQREYIQKRRLDRLQRER